MSTTSVHYTKGNMCKTFTSRAHGKVSARSAFIDASHLSIMHVHVYIQYTCVYVLRRTGEPISGLVQKHVPTGDGICTKEINCRHFENNQVWVKV